MVCVAEDFVAETDYTVFGFGDSRANAQHFIVTRRMVIAALHVGDNDLAVIFEFHAFVFDAQRAHKLDSADFEPD